MECCCEASNGVLLWSKQWSVVV